MEALTAVQVGLLTVYDMCKAVDRGMTITDVQVLEKHGGKSGDWVADLMTACVIAPPSRYSFEANATAQSSSLSSSSLTSPAGIP